MDELRKEQDKDLQSFGVKFDVYFLESSLYTDGAVEKTVQQLQAAGHTFEEEGALWLRTTDFGDDKDRVMKKSAAKGGDYTYFVPDVAYHVDKWQRGFKRAIDVQGADHHSTVTRVRVGLQALEMGITPGYPEYVLHQMVTVMKGGEEMKISKRAGSYVTVRDLVDEVGADALRYFFLMRRADSHLVFDVDLAKSQSEENPVYYVQMAHARMTGIFRVAARAPETANPETTDLSVLGRARRAGPHEGARRLARRRRGRGAKRSSRTASPATSKPWHDWPMPGTTSTACWARKKKPPVSCSPAPCGRCSPTASPSSGSAPRTGCNP